jgi:hypothetical protein
LQLKRERRVTDIDPTPRAPILAHRRPAMTSRHLAFEADDADLPVDEWTLDEFDAIDDPAELGSVRSSFAALDDVDD